jgi:hypothetical protein
MENLVEIFPNPLNLTITKNTTYLESKLNLRNLTNNYIIFKVFNNNGKIYSAKPSKSFIPPKETKSIQIKRFTKEDFSSKKEGEQFLLLFFSIDKIINNNDEVKEAFESKLYNPESKQESMISVVITDNENNQNKNEIIYDENDLNEVGNDNQKELNIYNNLIDNLKKEYNKTNQNIVQLENLLEVIKTQIKLKNEKDKAISTSKAKNKDISNKTINNLVLISIIILGLIFGANLACKYNKLFVYKPRIIKQIILNPSENYIQNKINEINHIKINKGNIFEGDFLTWRFFIAIYLLCLQFII